jgi:arginine/lysine/ornithine decarboxylase
MPGHKGKPLPGFPLSEIFPYDITEIRGADSLLSAKGIILESEQNAAKLFGTLKTVYSTEGSTLCVKTMLAMVFAEGEGYSGTVIATRKAHRSFSDAAALLRLNVIWADTHREIEKAIQNRAVKALYITSPDYFGRFEEIKKLACIAHRAGKVLIVDNAHGSYLKFIDNFAHPVDLGADLVCDSAHKTLPVLTGGAYLHIMNQLYLESYKPQMKVFASTSPSYLILQSLDYLNLLLSDGRFIKTMNDRAIKLIELKDKHGIKTPEPYKIAVKTTASAEQLCERYNVEPEYVSKDILLFMFSGASSDEDIEAADAVLSEAGLLQKPAYEDERKMFETFGYN